MNTGGGGAPGPRRAAPAAAGSAQHGRPPGEDQRPSSDSSQEPPTPAARDLPTMVKLPPPGALFPGHGQGYPYAYGTPFAQANTSAGEGPPLTREEADFVVAASRFSSFSTRLPVDAPAPADDIARVQEAQQSVHERGQELEREVEQLQRRERQIQHERVMLMQQEHMLNERERQLRDQGRSPQFDQETALYQPRHREHSEVVPMPQGPAVLNVAEDEARYTHQRQQLVRRRDNNTEQRHLRIEEQNALSSIKGGRVLPLATEDIYADSAPRQRQAEILHAKDTEVIHRAWRRLCRQAGGTDGGSGSKSKSSSRGTDAPPKKATAFQRFSVIFRQLLRKHDGFMTNADLNKKLGLLWRSLSKEEQRQYLGSDAASPPPIPRAWASVTQET